MSDNFYIDDNQGKILVNQITTNMRRERAQSRRKYAKRGKQLPVLKSHDILNFKNIKRLSFEKFVHENPYKFQWGKTIDFFKGITIEESSYRSAYEWDSVEYFYNKRNGFLPLVFRISSSRYDKAFLTDFFTYLNPPLYCQRIIEVFGDQDLQLNDYTMVVEDDLIMQFDTQDLSFFINPSKHLERSDDNPFYIILRLLSNYKKKSAEKNQIHVVYRGDYGFDKMAFDVKKIDIDIEMNYNDDFKDVSEYIINHLNDKKKTGLYILSGDPGTGKTTWIRYLAGKIRRNIIFVSPDMVDHITDPSFIPFLMNNSDSVLIIEDAEPALQKRDGTGRTGAISNILNLTDGLLSDCLNISIVATFNTNTKTIDEALLRDGRLVKSYAFEKLNPQKASKLLKKIGHDIEVTKPMTLSEIYFYGEDNKGNLFKQNKVGFH